MSLSVGTDIAADFDLLGKVVGDLQEDVTVGAGNIKGTLHYVTGYTGFSSKTAERKGNYLALKCTAEEGATITVELINGTVGHPVTLDADGVIILRIADKDTQSVQVVATKGDITETLDYSLKKLTIEPEA